MPRIIDVGIQAFQRIAPFDPIESETDAKIRFLGRKRYYEELAAENAKDVSGYVLSLLNLEQAGQSRDNLADAQNKIHELNQQGPRLIGRRRLFGRIPLWKTEIPLPVSVD